MSETDGEGLLIDHEAVAARREALEVCVTALSALPQRDTGRVLASLAAFFGLRYERSDYGFHSGQED